MDFAKLIKFAVDNGASDLHIQSAAAPILRMHGTLRTIEGGAISRDDVLNFLTSIAPPHRAATLAKDAVQGVDFAYEQADAARFRCSAYCALGQLGVTMRVIRRQIPSIEDLHLPRV